MRHSRFGGALGVFLAIIALGVVLLFGILLGIFIGQDREILPISLSDLSTISRNPPSASTTPCNDAVLTQVKLAVDSTLFEGAAEAEMYGMLLEDYTWMISPSQENRCTVSMFVKVNGHDTEYFRFYTDLSDGGIYGDNPKAVQYMLLLGERRISPP